MRAQPDTSSSDSRDEAAPPDTATMRPLIDEGLAVTGILPPYERLTELDTRLRMAIRDLSRKAQKKADGLDRGTPEWYALQSSIDNARLALADNLGPGLRSAALHVAELARRCRALYDHCVPSDGEQ